MLIIVGLIALAVVALLAAFLLARGGDGENSTPSVKASARPEQDNSIVQETVPATPITQPMQATGRLTRQLTVEDDELAAYTDHEHIRTQQLPSHEHEDSNQPSADGYRENLSSLSLQLYELADQLHSLQGQTREIEQNLAHLSSAIEQLTSLSKKHA